MARRRRIGRNWPVCETVADEKRRDQIYVVLEDEILVAMERWEELETKAAG